MSFWHWIKSKLYQRHPGESKLIPGVTMLEIDTRIGAATPVTETERGKLWLKIATNYCPDCGHQGFIEGPSGGLSTNIFCANKECGHGFNVTPVIGIAERI